MHKKLPLFAHLEVEGHQIEKSLLNVQRGTSTTLRVFGLRSVGKYDLLTTAPNALHSPIEDFDPQSRKKTSKCHLGQVQA